MYPWIYCAMYFIIKWIGTVGPFGVAGLLQCVRVRPELRSIMWRALFTKQWTCSCFASIYILFCHVYNKISVQPIMLTNKTTRHKLHFEEFTMATYAVSSLLEYSINQNGKHCFPLIIGKYLCKHFETLNSTRHYCIEIHHDLLLSIKCI